MATSSIASLVVSLEANIAKFSTDMTRAADVTQKTMDGITKAAVSARNALMSIGAGISVTALAKSAIDAADAVHKLSQQTGIAAKDIDQLTIVAKLNDVEASGLVKSYKALATAMNEAGDPASKQAKMFAALGVATRDAQGNLRNLKDVTLDIAKVFAAAKDGPEKMAVAVAAFGKAGVEMIPVLNNMAEDMDRAAKVQAAFGAISTETAAAGDQFNDSMTLIAEGMKRTFLPVVDSMGPAMDRFATAMINTGAAGSALSPVLDIIFKNILPAAVETVGALIIAANSLAKALGNLLGGLAASLVQLASGNFGAAWDTAKAAFSDSGAIIRESNVQIEGLMNRSNAAAPAIAKTADATNRMAAAARAVADPVKKAADGMKAWEKALKEWNEQMKAMDDARAHWLKAEQDKLDLIYKSIESEQKTIDGIRQTTEGYDKQAAAITYTTEELLKKEQARVIEIANNLRVMEGAERLVQAYDEQAAAIGRLIDANKSSEFKKSLEEQEKEFKRTYDSISNTITDALMRGFEGGKGWAKNFIQTLKNMFSTLVLRPIIQGIVAPVAGGITGLLSGGAQAAGLGGGSLGNLFSSGASLASSAAGGISSLFGASGFTAGLAGDAFLPGALAGGMGGAGFGAAMAPVMAALPWAALAAVAIPMVIKLFKGKPGMREATFGSGGDVFEHPEFSGRSAFGTFGITTDKRLDMTDKGAQVLPALMKSIEGLDNSIAKMVGGDLSRQIADTLAKHEVTVGMGRNKTDVGASGGPEEIFRDRYAVVLDTIHTGMGQMIRDFEGGGDELAQFVLTLASFETEAVSATDALGEAQRTLAESFSALGMSIPDSAQGFNELVQGLDLSTAAGRETLSMLIDLQPAFINVSNAIAGLTSSIQNSIDNIRGVSTGDRIARDLSGAIDAFVKTHDWAGPLREQLGDVGFAKNMATIDPSGEDIANYAANDAAGLAQIDKILKIYDAMIQGGATATQAVSQSTQAVSQWTGVVDAAENGVDRLLEELNRLRQGIRDYVDSLKLGDLSPLTPMQKFAEARGQYERTLSSASAGDQQALSDITGAADAYLRASRNVFASAPAYTEIFNRTTGQLTELGGGAKYVAPQVDFTTPTAAVPASEKTASAAPPASTQADISTMTVNIISAIYEAAALTAKTGAEDAGKIAASVDRSKTALVEAIMTGLK